jgi:hypothetical protein
MLPFNIVYIVYRQIYKNEEINDGTKHDVKLHKIVKFLQLIFNVNDFVIKYRYIHTHAISPKG